MITFHSYSPPILAQQYVGRIFHCLCSLLIITGVITPGRIEIVVIGLKHLLWVSSPSPCSFKKERRCPTGRSFNLPRTQHKVFSTSKFFLFELSPKHNQWNWSMASRCDVNIDIRFTKSLSAGDRKVIDSFQTTSTHITGESLKLKAGWVGQK